MRNGASAPSARDRGRARGRARARASGRRPRRRGCRRCRSAASCPARPLLPLGVLRRLAGLLEAVLAALLLARVPREQAGLLQRRPRLGVERHERPGDAERERAGLAADAAAADRGVDVVDVGGLGEAQRLGRADAVRGDVEVAARSSRPLITTLPVPGRSRTRATASLRRPVVWMRGLLTSALSLDGGFDGSGRDCGCCAACGWVGPA